MPPSRFKKPDISTPIPPLPPPIRSGVPLNPGLPPIPKPVSATKGKSARTRAVSKPVQGSESNEQKSTPISIPVEPYISIQITNFRCWDGVHTFYLPLHRGLVLIQGQSGRGKTSIISAINWVLSGKTAVNSCSWGKKRMMCEVSWFPVHPTLSNLRSISRCNTPRQFKLTFTDGTVIDTTAEAEAWLAQQVGIPFSLIGQLSLLSQKLLGVHQHLMQLPQADKSIFLQQLFVPDERHKDLVESLRTFCKLKSKEAEHNLLVSNALLKQARSNIEDWENQNDHPVSGMMLSPVEIERRIQELERIHQSWMEYETRRSLFQGALAHLRQAFESSVHSSLLVPFEEWVTDWQGGDVLHAELDGLVQDCEAISREQLHTANAITLAVLETEERSHRQARVTRAQQELDRRISRCASYSEETVTVQTKKVNELERKLEQHKRVSQALQKHIKQFGMDDDIEQTVQRLEAESMSLTCPSCQSSIRFDAERGWILNESELVVSHTSSSSAPSLHTQLSAQLQVMKDKQRWEGVLSERKRLTRDIEEQSMSDKDVQNTSEEISRLNQSIQTGRTLLQERKRAEDELLSSQRALTEPSSSMLVRARSQPTEGALPDSDRWSVDVHMEASTLYRNIGQMIRDLRPVSAPPEHTRWTPEHASELINCRVQLNSHSEYERVQKWKREAEQSERTSERESNRFEGARILERLCREMELSVLQQHLVPLNSVLQQLLDEVMFQEGGEMQCQFQIGSTGSKPEVLMSLFQRGQSCEERSLSGGEYDRLALAVSLTLYRLFASKVGILCLDESLSSLDAEVSNGILMRLHDNRTLVPGLVVMVDHHNGTGMFDYTLRV